MSPGRPIRLVLVGRRDAVGWCAPEGPQDGLEPVWLEPDEDLRRVAADLVVCLQPGRADPSALAQVRAPLVGWAGLDGEAPAAPPDAFARVIATGPTPPETSVWRSQPPPVSDGLYRSVEPWGPERPRVIAAGGPTPYRDAVLAQLGSPERDEDHPPLSRADVLCLVHERPQAPAFPAALPAALAAGALVVSEPLTPGYGLEPGIDFLEGTSAAELAAHVDLARRSPAAVLRVRRRGRAKAEALRASRVWPALAADLLRDLEVFG